MMRPGERGILPADSGVPEDAVARRAGLLPDEPKAGGPSIRALKPMHQEAPP